MKARNGTAQWAVQSVTGGRLFWALLLSAVLSLCGAARAQTDVNLPAVRGGPAGPAGLAAATPTTTLAEVTGNDVRMRSGNGTNFYECGRLYKGERVQVAKVLQGWSAIVPPPASYSWIAVQYVSVSIQNPTEGIVTGSNVPVYAGSDDLEPMVSTSKQDVTLDRGQKVRLLNEEKEEYYKIAPPAGAYLWVSSQFLQPVQGPGVSLPGAARGGTQPQIGQGPTTPAVTQTEDALLKDYYALSKQITEEQKKPLAQQDFAALKEKLKALAGNKEAGRAARYAQYTLKQVDRFELARTAGKEIELQNQDIKDSSTKIEDALKARLGQVDDTGKYAVIGKLQPSALYSTAVAGQARRYQLLDDSGRVKCYVAPAGPATGKDLTPFIGHKVGLVGQIQPQAATATAFVEFSDIVRLD